MPIDTTIEGDPESVRAAAQWLRESLGTGVSDAASMIFKARNAADAGWEGEAGQAYRDKMTKGAKKADDLATAATDCALKFDDYAAELDRALDDINRVRERAAAAGLSVRGEVIEDPGPPPPSPGPAPSGSAATPEAVATYNETTAAAADHAALVDAYNSAKHAANAARTVAKLAADTLKNVLSDVTSKWFFVVGDLANGAAETLAAKHSSVLMKQSKFLSEEAATFLERAKTAPAGTPAAQVYKDFDASRAAAHSADDAAKAAATADARAGRLALKAGGALAVAGVAYDVANGKPVDQAVVSGAVGFGTSVLAGAAIGSAIPVPVVGTAAGALGGAVVGVFASGMVDSLYENGVGAVGDAIEEGAQAVGDAGKAIGNLAEDAWNAVF